LNTLIKQTLNSSKYRILSIGLGLVSSLLIARNITPTERGEISLITLTLTLYALISQLGIPEAIVFSVGQKQYDEDEIISTTVIFSLIISTFILIIVIPFYSQNNINFFGFLFIVSLLSLNISSFLKNFLLGKKKLAPYYFSETCKNFSLLFLIIFFIYFDSLEISNLFFCYAISYLFPLIINFFFIKNYFYKKKFRFIFNKNCFINIFKNGKHLFVSSLLAYGYNRIIYFLLKVFIDNEAVGYWATISVIPILFSEIPQLFSNSLYSYTANSKETKVNTKNFIISFRFVLILAIVLFIPLLIFSNKITLLLFGNQYSGISNIFCLMFISYLFSGLNNLILNALTGEGRYKYNTIFSILNFSLITFLGILLIPKFGLFGACLAQLITSIINLIFFLMIYSRISKVRIKSIFLIN
tara:strand:+ start:102 stop:1343 length:1242 start_codon:yes stop_codon:yes gene_type:complete